MNKAKDAFFDAKDQIKAALNHRRQKHAVEVQGLVASGASMDVHAHIFAKAKLEAYEEMHNFVRNAVLFDTEKYK